MTPPATPTWTPPGPGSWTCDRSHCSPAPTLLFRRIAGNHTAPVYRRIMEQFGGAAGTMELQFVHGAMYRRVVPLVAPDRDRGKVPPAFVLWLLTRLHPEFRRRERTAYRVLNERIFEDDVTNWIERERFEWIDDNTALQSIDVGQLDDRGLAEHLRHLNRRLIDGWVRHHELHANDLGPIGDLLVHARKWGIDEVEVMSLLRGSSPATLAATDHGEAIAAALRGGGVDPATVTQLDQIKAVPEAAIAVDDYLATFGWRLITDNDIEGLTLHELPGAIVTLVRRAGQNATAELNDDNDHSRAEATLRARAGDPELFDELLGAARDAYGVRDDNGPILWAWPAGLTRRAYLEAGRRLADRNRLDDPGLVFELDIDELADALDGSPRPTSSDLAQRAATRRWEATLDPPDVLGPPVPDLDTSALPPSIRRMMDILLATTSMLEPAPVDAPVPLTGLGIGSESHTGTARVADDPAELVAVMEPGDVLVAPWTSPSFNAVLAIAGAVVVQEGGLLCHAAVMVRELGIPAVIGCREAMSGIGNGDTVTVDPTSGMVHVIDAALTTATS